MRAGAGAGRAGGWDAMITTREARLAAEEWIRGEAQRVPELVGVILAGSTRPRPLEAPHPTGSDLDIFFYVDAEVPRDVLEPRGRFAPRKLAYRGVVLEPSFHPARKIADPEAVLGDPNLAPAFTDPLLVLDPQGRLAALAAAVKPEVNRRRHVARRLERALGEPSTVGQRATFPDLPALRAHCWHNAAFAFGLLRFTSAVLTAGLRYPTVRRGLVVAREVLLAAGRADLADGLLRLLGSFDLRRADVEALAGETERAYDAAVEVRRTPMVMDWNVSPDTRALERAAIRELIEAGHHREAMFQLLLVRTAVQGILEADAAPALLEETRAGYERLEVALGIQGDEALAARGEAQRAFFPVLRAGCEELLARAPGIVD
jgi:hypothetical protein